MEQSALDIYDLLLAPFYLCLVFFIANHIKNKNLYIHKKSYYKYLIPALTCKIIGGIGVCLIYTYYYKDGGDVTNYYFTSCTFLNVLLDGEFEKFIKALDFTTSSGIVDGIVNSNGKYGGFYFNPNDDYAMFTVRLTSFFCLLGFKSFVVSTILLASLSFVGLWKLYEVFIYQFPNLQKQFAISIFFIPSVFFWGSGILKDTYTLSCVGFFTYGIFNYFIIKNKKLKYLFCFLLASIIILFIKPYIIFALIPGTLIWINFSKIKKIKNPVLQTLFVPLVLSAIVILLGVIFTFLDQYLGEYGVNNILNKAVKTQQDLVRSQYGGNNHDIGIYEPTLAGIASKIPAALNMALFRPFIWDARNPVMLLSGIENLFMLGFSIYILLKVKITTLFKSLFSHPLLIYSFLFAIFFAFSVGLTTANYGALVRLKIPYMPFYIASLFILFDLNKISFRRK